MSTTYADGSPKRRSMRERIFKRDYGVCALCGIDAETLRRDLVKKIYVTGGGPQKPSYYGDDRPHEREWAAACATIGFPPWRSFWDVDHIIPFIRGGPCSLENLRTLCRPCHVNVTRAMQQKKA